MMIISLLLFKYTQLVQTKEIEFNSYFKETHLNWCREWELP